MPRRKPRPRPLDPEAYPFSRDGLRHLRADYDITTPDDLFDLNLLSTALQRFQILRNLADRRFFTETLVAPPSAALVSIEASTSVLEALQDRCVEVLDRIYTVIERHRRERG